MQDSQPSSELQEWHVGKRLTSPPVNEGGGGWWLVAGTSPCCNGVCGLAELLDKTSRPGTPREYR
ncbi:MAG: hypothetical protein O3B68_21500 [Planctomycetota bacterium]|nr:hypothetical protein [Planctomycetota bacterium]